MAVLYSAIGMRGALAVLLILIATPDAPELPPTLQASFEEGVQALRAERLPEAEAAFARVLAAPGGELAFVHNNLGIVYQRRREHAKAIEQFRAAIRLDPSYVAPRILLGASLMAQGRAADSVAPLKQAVKLAPKDALARQQLAQAYERTSNTVAAVEQYRVLRDLLPEDPEYIYRLGKAYQALSEWSLGQIREVDRHSARLFQALGHNYRAQGKSELAVSAFERAAEADPSLPEVHLALAQIHLAEKRWAEARREIDRELQLVPESAGARALQQRLSALEAQSP
jgi:tetratricopeptide (TPR) repeat protein